MDDAAFLVGISWSSTVTLKACYSKTALHIRRRVGTDEKPDEVNKMLSCFRTYMGQTSIHTFPFGLCRCPQMESPFLVFLLLSAWNKAFPSICLIQVPSQAYASALTG
jgi:hypothetical protein